MFFIMEMLGVIAVDDKETNGGKRLKEQINKFISFTMNVFR